MTIITDATALILLAKVDLLEIFVDSNKVVVLKRVYEEVVRGKNKGRADSMLVERLLAEGKLSMKSPDDAIKDRLGEMFNVTGGELDVVSIGVADRGVVLTDDKKCINAAKALNIGFITSLDILVATYQKRAITKEVALGCVDGLEEYGWYSKELIKMYRGMIK